MAQQLFHVVPEPPNAGLPITICYDFGQVGPLITQATISVEWDPPSGSTSHVVTREDPCVQVTVPGGALGLTLVDKNPKLSANWYGTVAHPPVEE